jgi:hypothetical protein
MVHNVTQKNKNIIKYFILSWLVRGVDLISDVLSACYMYPEAENC